jgi:hypothetical protein
MQKCINGVFAARDTDDHESIAHWLEEVADIAQSQAGASRGRSFTRKSGLSQGRCWDGRSGVQRQLQCSAWRRPSAGARLSVRHARRRRQPPLRRLRPRSGAQRRLRARARFSGVRCVATNKSFLHMGVHCSVFAGVSSEFVLTYQACKCPRSEGVKHTCASRLRARSMLTAVACSAHAKHLVHRRTGQRICGPACARLLQGPREAGCGRGLLAMAAGAGSSLTTEQCMYSVVHRCAYPPGAPSTALRPTQPASQHAPVFLL